ncbi:MULTISPECIES: hypothetical protein [Pseudofrankia]|uniref:hypothetical protein n=1 Tax=Pseudofrankia TaxID=2994363 RepID=UPI0002D5774F|nr:MULTISPECIES: hypothetical protein [Pseudofrankia]
MRGSKKIFGYTPIDGAYDQPSPLPDQLAWLRHADFEPAVAWQHDDLAVIAADRR